MPKLVAINISEKRGTVKKEIPQVELIENWGLAGDAHAGNWHRQVSLLSYEKIENFKAKGAEIANGAFGENLIIEGIDLRALPLGSRIHIGETILELSQIGKECHTHCEIYQRMGECIMPTEGVFAVVIKGGEIKPGDVVRTEQPNLYRSLQDKPAGSKALVATVAEGTCMGQKALFLDGRIRVAKGDFWDREAEKSISEQSTCRGICNCKDTAVFLQPMGECARLIICGGGHVSAALVQMAKLLDFEIWVLEDRPFFADRAREAGTDKVICDTYENALQQVPESSDNYYVCVTRGHRFDQECLERILAGPFAYVGMMGSKRRSILIRESLLSKGLPADAVEKLHAPIGLSIGSETPSEIALSIAAELVQCRSVATKNRPADKEILQVLAQPDTQEKCILCTIINKRGSTPRGMGTQMLVKADGTVIGTVGGGCAEAEVITACRSKLQLDETKAEMVQVKMTTEDAEKEGMVCGGQIAVLLETI